MRKCNEVYCIVLYCIVLYCIVLYCIVLYCIVLYCIVLYCIVLYCIVLYCIVLYCIVLYCIVLYCIVLYCIVLYCIVLYCIVLYCIVLFSLLSQFSLLSGQRRTFLLCSRIKVQVIKLTVTIYCDYNHITLVNKDSVNTKNIPTTSPTMPTAIQSKFYKNPTSFRKPPPELLNRSN